MKRPRHPDAALCVKNYYMKTLLSQRLVKKHYDTLV